MTDPTKLRQEIENIVLNSSIRGMFSTGWEDRLLALIEREKAEAYQYGYDEAVMSDGYFPKLSESMTDPTKLRTFTDWLKTHGCSTYELWLILNCLITCLGWEHELTKEAAKAWRASKLTKPESDSQPSL